MQDNTRRILKLFVEKAHKLKSLQFTKYILDQKKLSVTFTMREEHIVIEHVIPDEEATDAFVLTFRLFIHDRDGISFRSLARKIMDDPGLSDEWKEGLTEVRSILEQYFNTCPIPIVGAYSPTSREIMDVFLFGNLAHTDEDKQKIFEEWQSNPFLFALFKHQFYSVLWTVFNCIAHVSYLSEQELIKDGGEI